jgi:hypothetical protein
VTHVHRNQSWTCRCTLAPTLSARTPPGVLAVVLLGAVYGTPSAADESSREQMRSLDEQVQDVKSDVLRIAVELDQLEEKLLYPSNTQVAIFVSLADGETFRLDSVEIKIDGEPVARHIYSLKELEALQKGGVQRIYTGNVRTGEHQLEVSMTGKLPGGKDVNGMRSFAFDKDVEPKLVGITLAGSDSSDASIQLGGW